jgi:hypothetical protein
MKKIEVFKNVNEELAQGEIRILETRELASEISL